MELVALKESDEIVASRLEEAYANSQPYQWAIELWRNFQQAIERLDPEAREKAIQKFDLLNLHGGTLKRVVWNTGPHMTEKEMNDYFTIIGKGHGNTWRMDNPTGNRHAGAREMILPWNPAGMVVVSYHPVHLPEGAMVWIVRDPESGGFALKPLTTGYENFDDSM
ncbi:unnamed protein product, partial [marine sediment metagenome]